MAQYTASGFKTQQDTRFADNSNGDIDEADFRNVFDDVSDSCAFTADTNIFSEDNIFGEIDHVQVFGATSIDAYSNTNEVQPTTHVYCDDQYAIAIENTDNVDADTKRWILGQQDDGDFVLGRISESGGTDTFNSVFQINQSNNIKIFGEFGSNLDIPANLNTGTDDGFNWVNGSNILSISANGGRVMTLRRRTSNGEIVRFFRDTTQVGDISVTASATAYNTSSDYRLKKDAKEIENPLKTNSRINYYNHGWVDGSPRSMGVFAHELQEVLPFAVTGKKDGEEMQSVDYSKIVPLLGACIQELNKRIDNLNQ